MKNIACRVILIFTLIAEVALADGPKSSAQYDEYAKVTHIEVTPLNVPDVGSFVEPARATAFLRASVMDSGSETAQIYISYHNSNGWKFFSTVHDIDGNSLEVISINREVQGSLGVEEEFAATLTKEYIAAHVLTGFNMRFQGKAGTLTVKIPPEYVQELVARIRLVEVDTITRAAAKNAGKPSEPPAPATNANRVRLGIGFAPMTDVLAGASGVIPTRGVLVLKVSAGEAADRAGFQQNDVVLAVGDKPVPPTASGLLSLLSGFAPGDEIVMTIWRAGQQIALPVKF